MSEISRSALFGKLNSLAYKAIEGATVFCKLRGNPYVELVHWMQQILQTQDSDLHRIIKHFELEPSRLAKDVTEALDRLPRGASSISDLSSHVENAVERGWVYGDADVRRAARPHRSSRRRDDEDAVAAQCADGHLAAVRAHQGRHLDRGLRAHRQRFARRQAWCDRQLADGGPGRSQRRDAPAQMGKQEALKRFATNLTDKARKGEIDPVSGPRRGDPPDCRHPHAPPAEQSDSDRRGRRRQNRRRRRLRAAAGAKRRPAAAAERVAVPRSISACCRPAPA